MTAALNRGVYLAVVRFGVVWTVLTLAGWWQS